jgi:hypothetical protein
MKVTNWSKKIRVALLATGILMPSISYAATNIPVGDPSFEDYVVPAFPPGYAYAAPPNGSYRPTSAWIDDQDSPPGYIQDNNASNWLYNADYADTNGRAAPRTGNQAMHGLFNYNSQETGAVFEAKRTYKFTLWAQNDVILNDTNGLFMYIFDGTVPFSDANSLANLGGAFTAINQRTAGMTRAQSQANWTRVALTHYVAPGAPEIGHPIGVGFFARRDTAVDDAALQVAPLLRLEVNTSTGVVTIKNQSGETAYIDYYEISSAGSSLNAVAWNSLQEQDLPGFPAGDGSGNGWEEFGGVTSKVIGESNPSGESGIAHHPTDGIGLGAAFRTGFPQDLVFEYGVFFDVVEVPGDFNGDFVVDAADYVAWRKNDGTPAGYQAFVTNFGRTGGPVGSSTLVRGDVVYVGPGGGAVAGVPEPSTVLLVGFGLASCTVANRRRSKEIKA